MTLSLAHCRSADALAFDGQVPIQNRKDTTFRMAKEGITPRAKDYARWYLDIVRGADLADYAEVVRGCIVFKPAGFALWNMRWIRSCGLSIPPP